MERCLACEADSVGTLEGSRFYLRQSGWPRSTVDAIQAALKGQQDAARGFNPWLGVIGARALKVAPDRRDMNELVANTLSANPLTPLSGRITVTRKTQG